MKQNWNCRTHGENYNKDILSQIQFSINSQSYLYTSIGVQNLFHKQLHIFLVIHFIRIKSTHCFYTRIIVYLNPKLINFPFSLTLHFALQKTLYKVSVLTIEAITF